MNRAPVSVSQLTALIRGTLLQVPDLEDVLVEGEVSNVSRPASGHLYFTIKDAAAQIKCVCFRGTLAMIPFRPENGMTVILHGHLDVYDQAGTYQLYVDRIDPSGVGALALAVEQRKRVLAAEGLFDARHKRPLPLLPRRVAVVTSTSGAAFRDVCTVIRRRAPTIDIVVVAATVQGPEAPASLVTAIARAQRIRNADVLLVVRGGGSLEDLMAFNDVDVARAIRASQLPVVVGVGHETDTTIADLCADQRAATPSAAAELAVPHVGQLRDDWQQRVIRLRHAARHNVHTKRRVIERVDARLAALSPLRRIAGMRQDIDMRVGRLRSATLAEAVQKRRILDRTLFRLTAASPEVRARRERERLIGRLERLQRAIEVKAAAARTETVRRQGRLEAAGPRPRIIALRAEIAARHRQLEALSPLRVLDRGYSITTDAATGKVVTAATAPGTHLRTRLASGEIASTVDPLTGNDR